MSSVTSSRQIYWRFIVKNLRVKYKKSLENPSRGVDLNVVNFCIKLSEVRSWNIILTGMVVVKNFVRGGIKK